MLQEQGTGTWDLRNMTPEPSTGFKVYLFFLLVTCVVAIIKLMRVWRAAPPFRLLRQGDSPTYRRQLEASSFSLQNWIGLTFLVWGIFATISLSETCYRLLGERAIRNVQILYAIIDSATALSMGLFAVLFLFVIRWHMLKRSERLKK